MEGGSNAIPMSRRNMVPSQAEEESYHSLILADYAPKVATVSQTLPDGSKKIYYVDGPPNNSVSNGQVAESEKGGGNQVMDGQAGSGEVEESVSVSAETDTQAYEDELYGEATGMSLDPATLLAYPKLEDVLYEMSCIHCAMPVGPPKISCAYGHLICEPCYDQLEDNAICNTMVGDANASDSCKGGFYEIIGTISNTPYFKYFLEVSQYNCFAEGLGCKVLSSGKDADHHEKRECPYRFVKFCGFRSGRDSCGATFTGWALHIKHMIETHGVPVYLGATGHFMVKYDREEFKNKKTNDQEFDVIPLVRAVHGAEDQEFLIVLMVKELGNDQTRVWFLDARADSGAETEKRYEVFVCIHPVKHDGNYDEVDADWIRKCVQKQLAVIPTISMLVNLEENPKDEDGLDYYLDLDNKVLNGIGEVKEGQKYFALMTKITEKPKATEKEGANLSPVGAVVEGRSDGGEEMDVDSRNWSVEASNSVTNERNDDEKMEDGEGH